jgi:uncharacterized protein YsxB (DUF464 family)
MKNIFKNLFKRKKKEDEYEHVPSFRVLQSFFNQVGRKRLIKALPDDKNKQRLTELVNEGFLAIDDNGRPKKATHTVNERFILGLTKIYLTYGRKIKIKQKK